MMMSSLLDIVDANGQRIGVGLVVAFSAPVRWDSVHHPHVFHVMLREDLFQDQPNTIFDCRCIYRTAMVAVDPTIVGNQVTAAAALAPPDAAPPGGEARAVALLIDSKAVSQLTRGDR